MKKIIVSAPCKIHLLGEHAVVYGKPAILTAVDLRVKVTIKPRHSGDPPAGGDSRIRSVNSGQVDSGQRAQLSQAFRPSLQSEARMTRILEPIIKKALELQTLPPYALAIDSQIPIGCGLGSSAAVSAAYFGAMLSFLGHPWDVDRINALAYEAEKIFHGNPSGGDNSTVCYGGLLWFQKKNDKKTITPLNFTIPAKLAQNFILINTGTPKESTKEMVMFVKDLSIKRPKAVETFLEKQEKLVRELLPVIKEAKESDFIRIIREGEHNLESIGVVSGFAQKIIREIEKAGGAAKICGGGARKKATGVLLTYHENPFIVENIALFHGLPFFKTALGVEGVRQDN